MRARESTCGGDGGGGGGDDGVRGTMTFSRTGAEPTAFERHTLQAGAGGQRRHIPRRGRSSTS